MRNTIGNSWALVKASAGVLNTDRALLLFPLLSGVATVGLVLSFIFPVMLFGGVEVLAGQRPMAGGVLLFLFYLVQYFIAFYFNAALVGAALIHLDGGRPTLSEGLRIASDHAVPLLGYAAISATVGLILNSIARKSGIGGRLVSGALGIGWSLATFLAVPVLVTRDIGPVGAIRESAALLKKSWGEQITGKVGMGLVFGAAAFVMGIVTVLLMTFGAVAGPLSMVPTIVFLVILWILFAVVTAALRGVFQAAVFRYAVTGAGGEGFEGVPIGEVIRTR